MIKRESFEVDGELIAGDGFSAGDVSDSGSQVQCEAAGGIDRRRL